jgi:hypothetical protein
VVTATDFPCIARDWPRPAGRSCTDHPRGVVSKTQFSSVFSIVFDDFDRDLTAEFFLSKIRHRAIDD